MEREDASNNPFEYLTPPCNRLTNEMAEKAKKAVGSGSMPDIIHRAMQLKNRKEEFEKHMLFLDGAVTNAALSVAITGPGQAVAMTHVLLAGQGVLGAHLAVRTRADNAYHMARQAIEETLGMEFADKIDALPYDSDGISKARKLLYEVDPRYNALNPDPAFNTKNLVTKEVKKGGESSQIQNVEWARATGSSNNNAQIMRRRAGFTR